MSQETQDLMKTEQQEINLKKKFLNKSLRGGILLQLGWSTNRSGIKSITEESLRRKSLNKNSLRNVVTVQQKPGRLLSTSWVGRAVLGPQTSSCVVVSL